MNSHQGTFTISLDFELFWGLHDYQTYAHCETKMRSTRAAIPKILNLFGQYGIHATWATVGLLFNQPNGITGTEQPSIAPLYDNSNLSPYRHATWPAVNENESTHPGKFAASLIELIGNTMGQEIGSHTYSHYYCLETGQTLTQFESDLKQALSIAKRGGYELTSLVFPRNQYTQEHIDIAGTLGFTAIRVQDSSPIYQPRTRTAEGLVCRLLRGLDSYLPISGNNVNDLDLLPKRDAVAQLPTSRFLRPWKPAQALLDPLLMHRIKHSMTQAAQSGNDFHLWWHPHNFGSYTDKNLSRLNQILSHYAALNAEYGYQSQNMGELAKRCAWKNSAPYASSVPTKRALRRVAHHDRLAEPNP